MTAELIDGPVVAEAIREEVAREAARLKQQTGKVPGLSVILVGDNPVSHVYVDSIEKSAVELGFWSDVHRLPATLNEEEILKIIDELNRNENVHGILVQVPLPDHIDDHKILYAVTPEKDVDGFHPMNVGNLVIGNDSFIPCTPHGCLKMLEYINYDLNGKHAVIVGRSNIVGKPMAMLLLQKNATITICHSQTANLSEICRLADVLVVAVGRPEIVKRDWVKPGAVVIDVGINHVGNKIKGDVSFDEVSQVAGYITPVPGGVGPMTITMLLLNTLISFKRTNR
ncbi:MAG: bifunctional methylenetetrahydrofolate dehydrogenase/methenyltetrahydrofolate cyclohydrolase FolD [Firmicutes bacterium HGW-Firmicutes-13]|nr:MAG: bifunctional methylenetetrahydrofolate dehydrogenase/methenyltetrahydrofolate cyclohydrolase FolD [Firmicutes bacterium HGW-Firmicutes-13]